CATARWGRGQRPLHTTRAPENPTGQWGGLGMPGAGGRIDPVRPRQDLLPGTLQQGSEPAVAGDREIRLSSGIPWGGASRRTYTRRRTTGHAHHTRLPTTHMAMLHSGCEIRIKAALNLLVSLFECHDSTHNLRRV